MFKRSIITGGFKEDIEIALVSDPKIKTGGEVREVSPALNATGAVRVKIAIQKPPPEMVLGSAVRVSAHAQDARDGGPALERPVLRRG